VLAVLLLLPWGFVFSWVGAFLGLTLSSPEAVQAASFKIIVALVFAGSIFVPVEATPGWLQAFVTVDPITARHRGARGLGAAGWRVSRRLRINLRCRGTPGAVVHRQLAWPQRMKRLVNVAGSAWPSRSRSGVVEGVGVRLPACPARRYLLPRVGSLSPRRRTSSRTSASTRT
jgi:hypothetical protein